MDNAYFLVADSWTTLGAFSLAWRCRSVDFVGPVAQALRDRPRHVLLLDVGKDHPNTHEAAVQDILAALKPDMEKGQLIVLGSLNERIVDLAKPEQLLIARQFGTDGGLARIAVSALVDHPHWPAWQAQHSSHSTSCWWLLLGENWVLEARSRHNANEVAEGRP